MSTNRTSLHRFALRGAVILCCCFLPLTACSGQQPPPPDKGALMAFEQDWTEVDRLISEQKFQAAGERTGEMRIAARQAGDGAGWTRALIKEVQLRTGLHGYETAVRFLREEDWPESPLYRLVLDLFYARSLVHYVQRYSWEIDQRERVETGEEVDLKVWTKDQIYAEAQRAYARVWEAREAWGAESLGELGEYVQQNDYPARIRGTLRDAVTYLWVELLSDTSLWRPEQSNEIFRLDLEALLDGSGAQEEEGGTDDGLADLDLHPLAKIGAILDDLEAWHHDRDRPEAAFEARLERLRRLQASFDQERDRERIREDLEQRLDRLGKRYPWWSMGMATLAEFVRDAGGSDALVVARKIALDGAEAHPGEPGGQRCRHLVATIEAPHYELAAMASDAAAKRSIEVRHKNVEKLYFRAYALDLAETLERSQDANVLPAHREVLQILGSRRPAAEWNVEVPATPDFQIHRTFVTPPLAEPGLYVVAASLRSDFREELNSRSAVNLIVTDLVLTSRLEEGGYDVTVRSGATGEALSGVEVALYLFEWRQGHRRIATATSGAEGGAKLATGDVQRGRYFLVARHGDDATVVLQPGGYFYRQPDAESTAALVYTDRSVYRPGQKIFWKVVGYRGNAARGRFQTFPGTALTVDLLDANYEVVTTAEVSTNDFGSASGEFEIPAGRLLGGWQVRASLGGSSQIRVEEYKRPTFEVTIADPEAPMRLNRPATLSGEVRYYFGLPVTSGEVAWRVTREPIFPRWWWFEPPAGGVQTIASGSAGLGSDGTFDVTYTPEADERLAVPSDQGGQVTYRYRLSADVTDDGGETRSAERTFRLGFVAVEARVEHETDFFDAGEPVELTIHRSDLDGLPRAGQGRYRLVALDQPTETLTPADQPLPPAPEGRFQTPDDRLRPRWEGGVSPETVLRSWGDGAEHAAGIAEHAASGEAKLAFDDLAAGAYRLHYSTRDEFGAEYETSRELLVVGGDAAGPLALPAILRAERSSVPVGGTARFLVHSGFAGQELVFEVFRGHERLERRLLRAEEAPRVLEIPISADDRGGFTVSLAGLRDHQLMSFTENVFVPWDDRELQVEFSTFRDRLRPGAAETWKITVRSGEDDLAAGAAEVLAYMYDRSLDVFAPHQPARPLSLYPTRYGVPPLASSLGRAHPSWRHAQLPRLPVYPRFRGDQLKFFDNYALGGPGLRRHRGVAKVQMMADAEAPMAAGMAEEGAVLAERAVPASPPAEPPPPPPAAEPPPPPESEEIRSDFSETAFWEPHLVTEADGSVSFEFEVPDSVTEWNVWAHALTRDLRSGATERQTRTVKELLVRPYLPRFFREGDRAGLKVVVNNAGEELLEGRLDFEIVDPETDRSLLADFGLSAEQARAVTFSVEPGGGIDLTFPVSVPRRVGAVTFRVTARAGDFSDGELRPLSVLPSRLYLAQSRFATLHDRDRRELHFADMAADDDPTRSHEQLVVTLDAQLFYGVLDALPYLVDYPYQCTEQTLNRFLSTGIVSSLFDDYPAIARMAEKLSVRDTRFEAFGGDDPNRAMALEETPWLRESRGGGEPAERLIKILDPEIARATRDASLAELRKAQTSLGGFPWWPGGPPSPHMTLYLLQGFSRALEFGVDVPQDLVQKAWAYVHRHYLDELARELTRDECCWEWITFLNYVLSSYPDVSWTGGVFSDDDRRTMLDFSFRHWRKHSPLLKGQLALTLQRSGRGDDARLVWDSVMDSARTTRDEGTFWAPEDRAWLWYNDTVETHAFALRTLAELDPRDTRRHGLVQWLFLNKKLNHWKSTRATAEAVYSLAHYLSAEDALGVREEVAVRIGPREETFVFEPDEYTGKKSQVVVAGGAVDPVTMSTIAVEKETKGLLFASATWHFATDELPEEARGDFFAVERSYFKRFHNGREWVLVPLAEGARLEPGDQVEVQLSIRSKHAAEYVHLRDPRGAGFEPESTTSRYKWDLGIGWYEEIRDSGTNFFFEWLPVGEYTFKYRLRTNVAGQFRVGPATIQSMYAPEFAAYSSGARLEIETKE